MNKAHGRLVLGLLLGLMITVPLMAQAQVFKWKEKNGAVQYSDTPPPGNVAYEMVDKAKPAPKPAPPSGADAQAVRNAAALRRQSDAELERRNEEKAKADLQAKQANCQNAKADYQNYKQGGRIYKMTPEGERQYLGDEDIRKGLESATKQVQQYCEPE